MKIEIDNQAGFCWGVIRSIEIVEKTLAKKPDKKLFVIGEIIHNPKEIERLRRLGALEADVEEFDKIAKENGVAVIRAHGEPPKTYKLAKEKKVDIIDATCPLVTKLQNRIKEKYKEGWQIVVFGKENHAEVIGLKGVCDDNAIVVKNVEEALEKIDFSRRTALFSQTTMSKKAYFSLIEDLKKTFREKNPDKNIEDLFVAANTLCKYVYGREDSLIEFCESNDLVLFVAGRNSSNGKSLFKLCKTVNPNSRFVEDASEIKKEWFRGIKTVGITGATSSPLWHLREIKEKLEKMDFSD